MSETSRAPRPKAIHFEASALRDAWASLLALRYPGFLWDASDYTCARSQEASCVALNPVFGISVVAQIMAPVMVV